VSEPAAVFVARDDGALVPTGHARGPWNPEHAHGGGPAALIARAVERLEAPGPMLLTRLTIEFLRPVPLVALTVEAAVTRPGRRLQVADAVLRADGEDVLRARAMRLRRADVPVPDRARARPELPGPELGQVLEQGGLGGIPATGAAFAYSAMELRFVEGRFEETGPATAWFRLRLPLVEGEQPTPAQRAAAAADFGNGIGREMDFETHLFVNTDLTMHLAREPVGEWIGLRSRTDHGPEGTALARSEMFDAEGPLGLAAQSLYVAERAPE
jgi:hypothetical protein